MENTALANKLEVLGEQYFEYLKVHGYRQATLVDYRKCLKKFWDYVRNERAITDLSEITPDVIYAYQSHLYYYESQGGRRLSMSFQLGILCTLRSFFRYLYDSGRVSYDPTSSIRMPKRPDRLPYVPTVEEVAKLLAAVDTSTPMGFRDRTIMEVLYASGIRAQELCALCLYDVNLDTREMHIRGGKGGKERIVPLGEVAKNYLEEYLAGVRDELLAGHTVDEIFISRFGKALLKTDMSQMIRKYRNLAGIEKPLTPHSLRHACASHLLKSGCDIRYIQQLLGHASLSTTQIYTRVEVTDLKAVHARCHPRERLTDEFL